MIEAVWTATKTPVTRVVHGRHATESYITFVRKENEGALCRSSLSLIHVDAQVFKLRDGTGPTQHRRVPDRIHTRHLSREAPFVSTHPAIFIHFLSVFSSAFLRTADGIFFSGGFCFFRSDLLDISPLLTEAAGAIVDVSSLLV